MGSTVELNESPKKSEVQSVDTEPLSFDEIIDRALESCNGLPLPCTTFVSNIEELRSRLAHGKLHLAVLGQFNRGKSTFINALIGMKILPASVLPLTSVPTLISWGQHVRCTIRFLNGKPDLIVQKSFEDITATLSMYVAEENNPGNQLCVREAEVNCPSPLLENGTMLIDTPGFGSTYLHNTRTALDTLKECDAALFLVSADPPLTQMEVEFLKQVQIHIPRIFFILNKIDLLSPAELVQVDRFIRETLVMRMAYSVDIRLYHVCAIKALSAGKQHESDVNWSGSGMEAVRSGILDFMIREKYFTLSQALTGKLLEALRGIVGVLRREIQEYQKPVTTMQGEFGGFVAGAESVRKAVEKEIALVDVERKAVLKYFDEQVAPGYKELETFFGSALNELLANQSGVIKSVDNLTVALNKILLQSLTDFRKSVINHVNRPIRKAVQVHCREFSVIHKMVVESIGDIADNLNSILQEKLEALEPDADDPWTFSSTVSKDGVVTEWSDWFQNRQTRVARIRNHLERLSKEMLSINVRECKADLRERFSTVFEKIRSVLRETYSILIGTIDAAAAKKESALVNRREKAESPVRILQEQINAVEAVEKLLS